jgi:hypothetical protein
VGSSPIASTRPHYTEHSALSRGPSPALRGRPRRSFIPRSPDVPIAAPGPSALSREAGQGQLRMRRLEGQFGGRGRCRGGRIRLGWAGPVDRWRADVKSPKVARRQLLMLVSVTPVTRSVNCSAEVCRLLVGRGVLPHHFVLAYRLISVPAPNSATTNFHAAPCPTASPQIRCAYSCNNSRLGFPRRVNASSGWMMQIQPFHRQPRLVCAWPAKSICL